MIKKVKQNAVYATVMIPVPHLPADIYPEKNLWADSDLFRNFLMLSLLNSSIFLQFILAFLAPLRRLIILETNNFISHFIYLICRMRHYKNCLLLLSQFFYHCLKKNSCFFINCRERFIH